jgi:hypothetical protein
MIIDVTKEEMDILERGIALYESDPLSSGLMKAVLQSTLAPQGMRPSEADTRVAMEQAERESAHRKLKAARLRVKFIEAMERPSEFQTS